MLIRYLVKDRMVLAYISSNFLKSCPSCPTCACTDECLVFKNTLKLVFHIFKLFRQFVGKVTLNVLFNTSLIYL